MSIIVSHEQFHLMTKSTSYVMSVYQKGFLLHHYWGERLFEKVELTHLAEEKLTGRATAFHVPLDETDSFFLSDLKLEFSGVGKGDWRVASVQAEYDNGSTVTEFEYDGYRIVNGKPRLSGLPAAYAQPEDDVETLVITFKDKLTGFKTELSYSVFYDFDIITRSVKYINEGKNTIKLLTADSACVDFAGKNYKLMHLHGEWLHERNVEFVDVSHGIYTIDSKKGMSSHSNNPFVALMDKNADEYSGNVYGFSLCYSGNFSASCEVSSCGSTRVTMGINPFNFSWRLEGGESFQSPEAVLAYSDCGINKMSRLYHNIYRKRLIRGKYRDKNRPVIANTWEAVGMDFTEDKVVAIARKAAEIGCDMLVLDDGWFGKRMNDKTSIGDWYPNPDKLPGGLGGLAEKVKKEGVELGIWLEPEMVSPDSELYRAHPDWCIYSEGRGRTTMRNTLVLDLSREEVVDYLFDSISAVLDCADIKYIKWDCNHYIVETGDMMQSHKFVLGLYKLLERLNSKYPDVLFEGCSGGGGRFDPGMLYYMPQTWTSDNTRVPCRGYIQYGTSMVYPAISMCAHIAKIDLTAKGEDKHLNASALTAMGGVFGFEIDLSEINDNVKEYCTRYVKLYKRIRSTVLFGDMYRLESPFEGNVFSWEFADENRALLFAFQLENLANSEERRIKLKGLETDAVYECNGRKYYGDELMKVGITVPLDVYEYHAQLMIFDRIN